MNNKITFVTCIYDDLFGTELGGRHNPTRKYFYGLESELKIDSPYVIFTWEKDVSKVESYFINFLGLEKFNQQIKVLPFNLYDTEIRDIIKNQKLKDTRIPGDRCYDVMFGKFLMLERAVKYNYFGSEKFFWIDAGLSSSSLFPNKHLDLSVSEKRYSWCYLFTPKVVDSLDKLSSDNILLLKMNDVGYWFDKKHLADYDGTWFIIGGLFGGDKQDIDILCRKVIESFVRHINDYSIMYTEEQILTILYSFDKESYSTIEFDVWYHEDSGDWVQDKIIGKKNFYKLFEEFNL